MSVIIESTAAKFTRLLHEYHVEYELKSLYDGYKWTFINYEGGDVAIHSGTYGADMGYVESYNMPWDEDDISVFTPEDMTRLLLGLEPEATSQSPTMFDLLESLATVCNMAG